MRFFPKLSFLFLGVLLLAVAAFAQTKKEGVRLTMANVRSTMTAYANTVELVVADRSLVAKLKAEEAKAKEDGSDNSFAVASKHLAAVDPRFQAAFTKAGTTPEQAGRVMETLFAIVLADGMVMDKSKPLDLPPMEAANLAFYREHKAEIMALVQQFQATAAKANKAFGEEQ